MRRSGLCFASGGDSVRAKSRARSDREQLGERGWHGERAGGGAQISQTARESEPDSRKKNMSEKTWPFATMKESACRKSLPR